MPTNAKRMRLTQPLAFRAGTIRVDRAARRIENVSLITRGPAVGHGYDIDDETLRQVSALLASKPRGVKSRLTHPESGWFGGADGIEVLVGRASNPRIEDGQVRGDIQFGRYADDSPSGKLATYLLGVAEEDPEAVGLSIVYEPAPFAERTDDQQRPLPPACRLQDLLAVDFVGDPGANPGGLLRQGAGESHEIEPELCKEKTMKPEVLAYLKSVGLKTDATEAEAQAFLAGLKGDQKDHAAALAAGQATSPVLPATVPPAVPPAVLTAAAAVELADQAAAKALAAERKRGADIRSLAAEKKLGAEWANRMVDEGRTLQEARLLAEELARFQADHPAVSIAVGADLNRDSIGPAMTDALLLRAGQKVEKPHDRAAAISGLRIIEMGRQYLSAFGVPGASAMTPTQVAKALLSREIGSRYFLSQSTSDFPYLLQNTARKILAKAYQEAPASWSRWAARGTVPDTKQMSIVSLSSAPALAVVTEGADYTIGTLSDKREVVTIAKYGKIIMFTLEALIGNDLGGFTRALRARGLAARRTEDDVAYVPLTSNQTMTEDSVALFHATTHKNLTSSGTAISCASLDVAAALMAKQTGLAGEYLNVDPVHLLVPQAKKGTAQQLIASTVDPSKSNAAANIWANRLTVTADARLDASSGTAWYLAADPNIVDTVMVFFLQDEPEPVLEEEEDFDSDARKYKVRHWCAARAIDYRGLYKNVGA